MLARRSGWFLLSFLILLVVIGSVHADLKQTTDTIFMVSPDDFQYNVETAKTNVFQRQIEKPEDAARLAMEQFNSMVENLEREGVIVIHVHSRKDIETPDAVFPNNWFSTHTTADGKNILVIYPMLTPNRRAEIRVELLKEKLKEHNIGIDGIIDLTYYTKNNKALEGTGSLVLDRVHHVAFVSLSPRTDKEIVNDFCNQLNYRPVFFHSYVQERTLIYHTNVMMSIGTDFAVVCTDSITDQKEKGDVLTELRRLGKKVIEISPGQMHNMCANILELRSKNGDKLIVMSSTAYQHFTPAQKIELEKFGKLVPVDIHTIESIGGGSARCMMAEVFYSEKGVME
jgi:hypothetical protein